MNNHLRNHPPRRQRGVSTLLIAMLLLAIVTLITLFAARYGVSEQRTSGNEYRYKMAFHVAETGLQQSMEYIKLNTAKMLSTATGGWLNPANMQWRPCTEATTMVPDPCLAEADVFRRAGMYRYVGGTSGVLPVAAVMPKLDAAADANKVGDFTAGYQSYAALCQLDMTIPTAPQCSLAPNTRGDFYITVVSRGTLSGEDSVATVKQSFGTFRLLGLTPDAPLIAASSSALGNTQIVPNPDAGGFGIPVSIWASGNAAVGGSGGASFATCQLGEWLDSGTPTSQDRINGICLDCTCNSLCPGYGLLSGKYPSSCSGGTGAPLEGEDILDNDGNADGSGTVVSDANPKVQNVKAQDFPKSLFAYVFGVSCDQAYSAGCPDATQYLTDYARPIPSTGVADCSQLDSNSGGLYWVSMDCGLPSADVGSLERPVVLVSDGPVSIAANTRVFGIIFVRSGMGFNASGGGQVYGSVILEGNAAITGGPTIVYNKAVLANVRNSPDFVRYGPIAGSWSDSL